MKDISDNIVKNSKNFAKKSRKLAKKLLGESKNILGDSVKGSHDLLNKSLNDGKKFAKNLQNRGSKVADDFSKGNVQDGLKHTGSMLKGTLDDIKNSVDSSLDSTLKNKYFTISIMILLALYSAFITPRLPRGFALFCDHIVIKIIMALLIVLISTKDIALAVLVALAYILTLQTANKYKLIDNSNNVEPKYSLNNEYFANNNEDEEESEEDTTNEVNEIIEIQNGGNNTSLEVVPAQNSNGLVNDDKVCVDNLGNNLCPDNIGDNNNLGQNVDIIASVDNLNIGNTQLNNSEEEVQPIYAENPVSSELLVNNEANNEVNNTLPTPVMSRCSYSVNNIVPSDNNLVLGTNQKSCVQSFKRQACIQGLNTPVPYSDDVVFSTVN